MRTFLATTLDGPDARRRLPAWPAILLVACCGSLPAAEYVLEQPVAMERLRLEVQLRPDGHEIVARADLRLTARKDRVSSFHLWLNQGFRIQHIRPAQGVRFAWERDRESPHFAPTTLPMRFDLAQPILQGDTFDMMLVYRGRIPGVVNGVNQIRPELTELALYSGWFPRVVGSGEFALEMIVTAPPGLTVLSHLDPDRQESGRRRSRTWFSGRSRSEDAILIAARDVQRRARTAGDGEVVLLHRDLPTDLADRILEEMLWLDGFYRESLGFRRADERLILFASPRGGWNYARPPLLVVSGNQLAGGLDPSTPSGRVNFRTLAHEIGHVWWSLADHYTYDDWLNEGLAEYFALMAVEERQGAQARRDVVRSYMDRIRRLSRVPSIGATLRSDPESEVLYFAKAAMVLRLLSGVMGKDRFLAALREYHDEYDDAEPGSGDTVAFRRIAERHHGESLVWFFQPWVYDAALPRVELEYEISEVGTGAWRVDGTLRQPENGSMTIPVDLAARGEDGQQEVRTVLVDRTEMPFSIAVPFRPVVVELDPADMVPGLSRPDGEGPVSAPPGEVRDLLRRARRLEDADRADEAELIYMEVLRIDADNFYALYRLGRIAAGREEWESALSHHLRADATRREYQSMWGWNLVRIGELHARRGALEPSRTAYLRALEEQDYLGSVEAARKGLAALGDEGEDSGR